MSNKYTSFFTHTPTLDTSAYADGDLMANPEIVSGAVPDGSEGITITDLVVFDKSDQGLAFDIYVTTDSTSWGTLRDAVSLTDAKADDIVGKISVVSGDFDDFVNAKVAFIHDLNVSVPHADGIRSFYIAMVSRGAGTYAADGLLLKFAAEKG